MLILSRKKDESIIIGDNIIVSIVDIKGDQVKLGINAPHDVKVFRQEVLKPYRKRTKPRPVPQLFRKISLCQIIEKGLNHRIIKYLFKFVMNRQKHIHKVGGQRFSPVPP